MRVTTTSVVIVALMIGSITFAGEIREFDVKTLQRLGNELIRVSQTSEKGAIVR